MSALAYNSPGAVSLVSAMNGRSWSPHQSAHFVPLGHSGQAIEWQVLAESCLSDVEHT
jgi:hypothetical protein